MNYRMRKFFSYLIVFSIVYSVVFTNFDLIVLDAKAMTFDKSKVVNKAIGKNENKSDKQQRIMILLDEKPVATSNNVANYSKSLKSKEDKVLNNQKNIIKQVEKITGNKIKNRSSYLVNTFSINATKSQMDKIEKIEGVKSVTIAPVYKALMNNALKSGNAYSQVKSKDYGYTGKGIVVAVIDSGVNYKHQDMKLDKGVVPKYSEAKWKEKIKLLGYGKYCSEKVPFGYDYVAGVNDCLNEGEDHGYHVSGIVSGNGDIQGVAPNAQIIGLKVLDEYGEGSMDDIICAIEDAVKLGADVINMSLGARYALSDDYIKQAVDNAAKYGIVVSIAAGNDGNSASAGDNKNLLGLKDTGYINSAATSKSAVTVAASVNSDYKMSGNMEAEIGSEVKSFQYVDIMGYGFEIKDTYIKDVSRILDEHGKIKGSEYVVKDNIAVVKYNKEKINNSLYDLSKAEAKGIIIIDNSDKINNNIRPYDWYGVPVIIVGKETGDMLINAANGYKKFTYISVEQGKESSTDVSMALFSSWGPSADLTIKPEITAPGANVKSTVDGKDNYAVYSGTSMAAPFIAGSSAIMLNAIKGRKLSVKKEYLNSFLKNSLMNTADAIYELGTDIPYSVRYQGAGQVDVYGAVNNNVLLTYKGCAKAELGELTGSREFNLTVSNYGTKSVSYELKETPIYTDYVNNESEDKTEYGLKPYEGVRLTYNRSKVVVPAKSKVTITAKLSVQKGLKNYGYVEGFVRLKGVNCEDIGMPVLGYYGKWASEPIIDKSVYDNKRSILSNKNNVSGIDSCTALASPYNIDSGYTYNIQGEYLVKKQMDTTPSDDKNVNREKVTLSREKANKAIKVELDTEYELPIVNEGDFALYKISSTEDTGFNIKVSSDMGYSTYRVYNENLDLIDTDDDKYTTVIGFKTSFSIKKNDVYYIEVGSAYGRQGLFSVRFQTDAYEKDADLSQCTYLDNSYEAITVGETKELFTGRDSVKCVSIVPKKSGYYKLDIKTDSMVQYELYRNNSYYFTIPTELIINGTEFNSVSKNVWLEAGSRYMLELYKPYTQIALDGGAKLEDSVFASITISETDDTNAYTLEKKYNSKYNAFSEVSGAKMRTVGVMLYQLRDAKELAIYIRNKDKRVVRKISHKFNAGKKSLLDLNMNEGMNSLYTWRELRNTFWDGKLYSKPLGKYVNAPSGQYYIQVVATITNKKQSIVMPVKIDNTKPKINSFKVEKKGVNTVVKFKVSDNNYIAPYYEINTKQPYQKRLDILGYEENEITYRKYYVDTKRNSNGEYEIDFGNIEDTSMNITFYDTAGNYVKSKNVEGEIYKNYKPTDNEDSDNEKKLYSLCDGVYLECLLNEDTIIHTDEDNSYLVEGECAKNLDIIVNGEVAEKEVFGNEKNKGYASFYLYAPINTSKSTAGIKISVRNNTTKKIIFNKVYTVKLDKEPPSIELVKSEGINKIYFNNIDNEYFVLLNEEHKKDFSFNIKVKEENFSEDSFEIDSDNVSYTYLGNQTYKVTINNVMESKAFGLELYDKSNYNSQYEIYLVPPKSAKEYDYMVDMVELYVDSTDLYESTITNEMLNSDGTLTISGEVKKVPDSLIINNKKVAVDPKTLTFTTRVKINKGITKVGIVISKNGKSKTVSATYYYDKMSISLKGIPKANKKGQIIVRNKNFKFSGTINSYTAINTIKVNGNSIYNERIVAAGKNKLIKRNFSYTSFLNRGKNTIYIIGYNMLGQSVVKKVVVYYIPKK